MAVATQRQPTTGGGAGLAASFRQRGYLEPLRLFESGECRTILAALRRERWPEPVWDKGLAVVSPAFYALATNERIIELVTALIGKDVLLWGASLQMRGPGAVHPWHTDIESADPDGETASVWIGLVNTNPASSLKVAPYSHEFGAPLQRVMQEQGKQREEVTDADVALWARDRHPGSGVVRVDARDGDAIVFDGRLWHGSENFNRAGTRQAALLQYATPRRPIRIPNLNRLTWPFEVYDTPRPPCVPVSGRAALEPNLLVPGPVTADERNQELRSIVTPVRLPLERDETTGWKPHPLFRGQTPSLKLLGCHASVLDPGRQPHPPHRHGDEEVLLILDGEAELILEAAGNPEATERRRVGRGTFAYYPAGFAHTLANVSERPVSYLMFKWVGEERRGRGWLPFQLAEVDGAEGSDGPSGEGLAVKAVWDGETAYLRGFHAHVTTLQPGGGYEPHVDAYDVALVLLEGTVETLGARLPAPGVAFYVAGEPHGIRNVGEEPAKYLVLEFHAARVEVPRPRRRRIAYLASRARRAPRRLAREVRRLLS
jgi:mannose-6-phosphate isomerase-like protein (cupin superfamily)